MVWFSSKLYPSFQLYYHRDSYVESDIDSRKDPNGSDSDDFADDEGCQSDNLSKTSSSGKVFLTILK